MKGALVLWSALLSATTPTLADNGDVGVPGWKKAAALRQARAAKRMRVHGQSFLAQVNRMIIGPMTEDAMIDPRIEPTYEGILYLNAATLNGAMCRMRGVLVFPGDGFNIPPNAIILCDTGDVIHTYASGFPGSRPPHPEKSDAFALASAAFFGQP